MYRELSRKVSKNIPTKSFLLSILESKLHGYPTFSLTAKIVNSQTKLSVLVRRMLSGGKRSLKHLGFTRGKTPSNIFETVYLLETGINLDVLEFIFRKSIAAGDIWQFAENTWTGIYNVLSTVGTTEQRGNPWEAALYPQTSGNQRGGVYCGIGKDI